MTRVFALALVFGVASCGLGGGGSSMPQALEIVTQGLPQGNVGRSYFQALDADGGTAPYTWRLSNSGDPLPQGLSLTNAGQVSGSPQEAASATVLVLVEDSTGTTDLASFSLAIRDVEITGAAEGAVTPGTAFALAASGGAPTYSFSLQANQSGGSLSGGGLYTAGADAGVDIVRATDRDGFFDEISISVGSDPFIGFTASWGTTDVWWIDWDVVYDPSPTYAADFDEVLVALGLRVPGSTGTQGTEADQLAKFLVIRRTLGHLSRYYGNNDDGSPGAGGLSISFVGPAGPGGGTTPGVGGVIGGAPNRYSTICIRYGNTGGVVGTAWLDNGNDSIEHDCGNPGGTPLGIFANRVLVPYLNAYNNGISSNPVGASDVDGIRAMLLGASPQGARQNAIWNVANGYGKVLGAVLAHEIGHSLGLDHSSPSGGAGDIMNASLFVSQSTNYAFNAGHWAILLDNLPGPNR
ncbi:MAG: putative Ig domain-containing protein [Planctomycetota bacterium]